MSENSHPLIIEISSSDEDKTPVKRSHSHKDPKVEGEEGDVLITEDLDCIILDSDPFKTIDISTKLVINDDAAEDLAIVYERGQVACRDYPHSRHLCGNFPFDKTPHESYCKQCYCYLCDTKAPCKDWEGHCNASGRDRLWKLMKGDRNVGEGQTAASTY